MPDLRDHNRTPDDHRLDDLAVDMSNFVNGWDLGDVIQVAAAICATAIRERTDSVQERYALLYSMVKMMEGVIEPDGPTLQ